MRAYLELLKDIQTNGTAKKDRTGVGTRGVFGRQLRFDLSAGFPLLTTKKVHWPAVVHELLWFLQGETNIKYLNENQVRIWDEWADALGELGPVYGKQWRAWEHNGTTIDQISNVIREIKQNPASRRLIVSAWNVGEIAAMALPPCHLLFQFYVQADKLSCQLYQRSADVFLGVPFNIASYALLTHMVAQVCGLTPGDFVHTFGDVHIYDNHQAQITEQLKRTPRALPRLELHPRPDIFSYTFEDIVLHDYQPHPRIPGVVAV